MHIVTLAVHYRGQRVSAHSVKSPTTKHDGGLLVTVYPGGSFLGLSFAALLELETGRHEIEGSDGRDFRNLGNPPDYHDEVERQVEWFEEILFGYQQGAYSSLEVLGAAERVLGARGTKRGET